MKPSILIRFSVAALAAATLLPAQSAPVARVRRAATSAEAASPDRVQVRLAEVIAMLEEDDLTPEQRTSAKKKLQEIVAGLRRSSAKAPTPSVAEAVEVEGGTDEAPRVFVRRSQPAEAAPPTPPKAPRAAKAPKPPKAPKAPQVFEIAEGEGFAPMAVRLHGENGEPMVVQMGEAEGEGDEHANMLRAHIQGLGEHLEALKLQGMKLQDMKLQGKELSAKKLQLDGDARVIIEHGGEWKTLGKGMQEQAAKAEQGAIEFELAEPVEGGSGKAAHAWRLDAERAAVRARAEADQARADSDQARAFVLERRGARGVARSRKAEAMKAVDGKDDGDDSGHHEGRDSDADIREMIESMRAEMREIRELMQQMRQRGGQGRTNASSFGGGMASSPNSGGLSGGGAGGMFTFGRPTVAAKAPSALAH